MTEEEKIFAGKMFDPRSEELRQIKHKAHEACRRYNTLAEYDPERQELMRSSLGSTGKTFTDVQGCPGGALSVLVI